MLQVLNPGRQKKDLLINVHIMFLRENCPCQDLHIKIKKLGERILGGECERNLKVFEKAIVLSKKKRISNYFSELVLL